MNDKPRPLLEHFEELRRRLFVVFMALAIIAALCYPFTGRVIHYLAGQTGGFVFTHLTEAFFVRLKIATIGGIFLTIPVVIYHLWQFVGAGLHWVERRSIGWILPFSYILFCGGVAVAWWIILPATTKVLLSYATPDVRPMISVSAYVGFIGWICLTMGFFFQMPLIILFMAKAGFVSVATLKHYRRHVAVGLAIAGAFISPDPISQLIVLAITYLLYEASILLSQFAVTRTPSVKLHRTNTD